MNSCKTFGFISINCKTHFEEFSFMNLIIMATTVGLSNGQTFLTCIEMNSDIVNLLLQI